MLEFIKDYEDLLEEAEASAYLTPREEEFISKLREKYEEYGNGAYISAAQIAWLERIVNKGLKSWK